MHTGLWSGTEWVQFLVLVPVSYVTLDMGINLSELPFPVLKNTHAVQWLKTLRNNAGVSHHNANKSQQQGLTS